MPQKIRAKFNVQSITTFGNSSGSKVVLQAVANGSEENKEFWKYTPSGQIEIFLSSDDTIPFEHGEYYVDFTKAE